MSPISHFVTEPRENFRPQISYQSGRPFGAHNLPDWKQSETDRKKTSVSLIALASALTLPTATANADTAQNQNQTVQVREIVLTRDIHGNPTSGMVTYPMGYEKPVEDSKFRTTANGVGGGTWTYGSKATLGLGKVCYSEYHHPSLIHSASVLMGGKRNKATSGPNRWAKTSVGLGFHEEHQGDEVCHAYWNTQKW